MLVRAYRAVGVLVDEEEHDLNNGQNDCGNQEAFEEAGERADIVDSLDDNANHAKERRT